ncbi:MAG: alpha/beta hydrolase [Pseudomonadota bacterium]
MASIAPDIGGLSHASAQSETEGPSPIWTLTEGRALFEFGAFLATRPLLGALPKGDGHAVMVLPGFMASNSSTGPLRRLLCSLGYDAHGWDSGRNIRVDNALIKRLREQLLDLFESSGRRVSLVGWSLGGVIARELAKLHPEKVRLVVSLGSPITNDRNVSNARRLFEMLNGGEPEVLRDGRFQALGEAPPVPTTSILTKTDGVVHWRGSVQDEGEHPSENIVVHASHLGLGVNPSVMIAIADRLAQDEGEWVPFAPGFAKSWMYPSQKLN